MSVQESSASLASRIARGGAPPWRVCWPRAAARTPRTWAPSPSGSSTRRRTTGFPIRPLYTALDALPEPPLPGQWPFVRGSDALRDVKSGWKVAESLPVPGQSLGGRRQRRGAGRADGGHQCAGAAGGCRRRRRGRARPAARGRLPGTGAGDPRRRTGEPTTSWPPTPCWHWSPTSTTSGAPGCRSIWAPTRSPHASSGTARAIARRRRCDRGQGGRVRRRGAGRHRRRSRLPRSRCERVVGTRRGRRRRRRATCGYSARTGCRSPDALRAVQLPLRRRRRPVHDDRQAPGGAPTVGPRRRGAGRTRGRAPPPCTP